MEPASTPMRISRRMLGPGERQHADEQAHGEADATQHGDAQELRPGRALRLAGELQGDRRE